MSETNAESTVYENKDPLCPIKFSIEPDGLLQTFTVEAMRVWVQNKDDKKIGSVAITLRCVMSPDATLAEVDYSKALAGMFRNAINRMLTTKPDVASSSPKAGGEGRG